MRSRSPMNRTGVGRDRAGGGLSRALPLLGALLDLFIPPVCTVCEDGLASGALCAGCKAGFEAERLTGPLCTVCGRVFPEKSGPDRVCGDCQKSPPPFELARSLFSFNGPVLEAVHALKYSHRTQIAVPLGELMARSAHGLPSPPEVVVPVPLHPGRLRKRGFNQSLLISKVIARRTGAELDRDGLRRTVETPAQVGLRAGDRRMNVAGAFSAKRDYAGRTALLVDDVYTTGATVGECARTLGKSGARVFVLTLARTI